MFSSASFLSCGSDNDDTGDNVEPVTGDSLLINEFMAKNRFSHKDDNGEAHDWVEIFNPTDQTVSLDGWSLTTDTALPQLARIADGHSLAPLERIVLFLEGPTVAEPSSDFHLPIVLDRKEGTIALYDGSQALVNELNYGEQAGEFSASRTPDGSDVWQVVWDITPGEANVAGAGQDSPSSPTETVPAIEDVSELMLGETVIKEFDLDIPEASMSALRAAPRVYAEAALTIDGRTFEPIGVRLKGNNSFRTIDEKPSFRIELDTFVPNGEIFGLDDLTLNNMIDDPSLMRERISYKVARDNGVTASRTSYAFINVNGTPYGLYSNIEHVERRMVERFFTDGTGTLFEATDVDMQLAPFTVDGTNIGTFNDYEHKSGPMSFTELEALSQAFASTLPVDSATDAEIAAALVTAEQFVEIEDFRNFWAVLGIVAQFDSFPYSFDDYYLYLNPSDMKYRFIPWGMDEAFGFCSGNVGGMLDCDYPLASDPAVDDHEEFRRWPLAGEPVLTDLCQNDDNCRIALLSKMCDVLTVVESSDWLADFDAVRSSLEEFASRESDKSYLTHTLMEIQNAQTNLRDFLETRRESFIWSINGVEGDAGVCP